MSIVPNGTIQEKRKKSVSFSTVTCRWYEREQGGSCSIPSSGGYSLGLSWRISTKQPPKLFLLDVYEGVVTEPPPKILPVQEQNYFPVQEKEEPKPPPPSSSSPPISKPIPKPTSKPSKKKRKQRKKQATAAAVTTTRSTEEYGSLSNSPNSPPLFLVSSYPPSSFMMPELPNNWHRSRIYPNFGGDPKYNLPKISPGKRRTLLQSCGVVCDPTEQKELERIRQQRKDVGCSCMYIARMKGKSCSQSAICECVANGIDCHAECCECLKSHIPKKPTNCKNPNRFYEYNEFAVNKYRKKTLKTANNNKIV
mmetsp:Transcript_21656/g.29748  ORF Transcript_21656/g.29748 Transcript_21656/m.29748 type:complete len:309 (-) Transcript_21656:9-935(-)